jgi:hypothetical protein
MRRTCTACTGLGSALVLATAGAVLACTGNAAAPSVPIDAAFEDVESSTGDAASEATVIADAAAETVAAMETGTEGAATEAGAEGGP